MTKNLSHELLTLKAVLLMRLIDKKEQRKDVRKISFLFGQGAQGIH